MNNLTTRKIVLGLLMTLVLAFSMQGIADAVNLNPSISEDDLSRLIIGDPITLTFGGSGLVDNVGVTNESVSVSVTRDRAEFEDPDDSDDTAYSHTWTESDDGITVPTTLAIDVLSAGELTVTVSWTDSEATKKSHNRSFVHTYYVVKNRLDVDLGDTIDLDGVSNGVGYPYDHRQDIEIYGGDSDHNAVTYAVSGDGTLYIREGNRVGEISAASLVTSSGAEVWLSMGTRRISAGVFARPEDGSTNTVTATVTGNSNVTQGIYIYGRPTLVVATGGDNPEVPPLNTDPALLEGNPGQVLAPAIRVEVFDEQIPPIQVAGVPVTFDVADKNVTGGPPATRICWRSRRWFKQCPNQSSCSRSHAIRSNCRGYCIESCRS